MNDHLIFARDLGDDDSVARYLEHTAYRFGEGELTRLVFESEP